MNLGNRIIKKTKKIWEDWYTLVKLLLQMIESPHGSPAGNRTLVSLARILTSILPRSEPEPCWTKTNFSVALEEKTNCGRAGRPIQKQLFPNGHHPQWSNSRKKDEAAEILEIYSRHNQYLFGKRNQTTAKWPKNLKKSPEKFWKRQHTTSGQEEKLNKNKKNMRNWRSLELIYKSRSQQVPMVSTPGVEPGH